MPRKNSSIKKVIETNIESNQSKVSLVLGALIVLVVGILVFNFFNKNKATLGPAQQTEKPTQTEKPLDVSKENLPGSYTVKEGDTLFTIAQKYYDDGEKFSEIAKANNLTDVNEIVTGQSLTIPKLEAASPAPTEPEVSPSPTETPSSSPAPPTTTSTTALGNPNSQWGPAITTESYTVVEGDWLSKIADRAYGDPLLFNKIAQANHISNPDHIEPGQVLTIPR